MKKNIAVVGCGYWGKNLTRVFNSIGALKTVFDSAEEGRETARKVAPGIDVVDRLEQILQDPKIEAVAIASPAESHANVAAECLNAGKHGFVEKPLALSVEDGKQIISLASKSKKILMIGHILNYHPALIKLKELIDQGDLGNIQYISSNRMNFGKLRREENILW